MNLVRNRLRYECQRKTQAELTIPIDMVILPMHKIGTKSSIISCMNVVETCEGKERIT